MKKIGKFLLIVLIAAMTLALSLGIAACNGTGDPAQNGGNGSQSGEQNGNNNGGSQNGNGQENNDGDKKATYTVTVTCDDSTVLTSVKVKLVQGADIVAEKELENGTATFSVEAGSYTVTLSGVPAEYRYEPKNLTSTVFSATIALTKKAPASSAADITVRVSAGKDLFGTDRPDTALRYAKLALYASAADLKPVASATTDDTGVAHFEKLAAGVYLASVNGKDCGNITVSNGAASLTVNGVSLGSQTAPLAWTVGENDLPFTREILESLGNERIYFTLTVAESGLYSFDADNYNASVQSDIFTADLEGMSKHATAVLSAGVLYTFSCTSMGAEGFGYKITVTAGDTGESAPAAPWPGSGTETEPYRLSALKGSYRVTVKYENGDYTPVYFRYTETDGTNYAIFSSDRNFHMDVHSESGDSYYNGGGSASDENSLFATESGAVYLLAVSPSDDSGTTDVTLSFTVSDYRGWLPKWSGSGRFQKAQTSPPTPKIDDPYLVTDLADSYEAHGANRIYFKYTAAETKNYTVTMAEDSQVTSLDFWLRNYNNGDPDDGPHYLLGPSQKSAVISLTEGVVYLFGVDGSDGNAEAHSKVLKFTITEGGTPETEGPTNPDEGGSDVGTAKNPETVTNLEGEYDKLANYRAGWHIRFTARESAIYSFINASAIGVFVRFGLPDATGKGTAIVPGAEKSFLTEANQEYLIVLTPQSESQVAFSVSVTKIVHEWAGKGTQDSPYVLTESEKIVVFVDSVKDTYFEYTAAEAEKITFVPTSKMTITLIGKTWDGVSSSEYRWTGPASDEKRTVTLGAGERAVFAVGLYVGNSSTEVGLKFTVGEEKEEQTAALFAESWVGTYLFLNGRNGDGEVAAEAEFIVSANAITWGTHRVKVLGADTAAGTYSLEIDGAAFTLKFTQKEENVILAELTGGDASYNFENNSAGKDDPGIL